MKLITLFRTGLIILYQSIKRFPVTIFHTTVTTVLLIIISRVDEKLTVDTLIRIAMITALGIPLSLCITLAFERLKSSKLVEYGSYALALGVLTLYYFFLLPDFGMVPMTRYLAVTLAAYLAFLSVPYFCIRPGFEMYIIKVVSRFLITALYSAILFAGLAITLLTIDLLLGIEVSGTFYSNVWFVVAGVFAPCFFLAGLPAVDQDMQLEGYPNVLKVLLLYIVMPIILTYTLILYIYFLKTLLTMEWPEGTVSHLVLWYSVFSAGVLFLIYPLVKDNKFVKLFTVWFPKLILPALLLMFTAISIRISAYGITENRYFVVALALWVFGAMLYYSLTTRFRNIVLPVSLALITLLAVSGPWSAYTLSRYSQNARFEALVAEYNMVDGDSLQRPDQEISDPDKIKIVSILEYFSRTHNLSDIELLPVGFEFNDMAQVFGFSREDTWSPGRQVYFNLNNRSQALDIRGFDFLLSSSSMITESITVDGLSVRYSPDKLELVVLRGSQEIYVKDLRTLGEEVVGNHGATSKEVPGEDMTFVDENENIQVKIIFTAIYGEENTDSDELKIDMLEFYLMFRDKD